MTTNQVSKAITVYGDKSDIEALADRIKAMLPGGGRYTPDEALMLSQFAVVQRLNPFNGECWLITSDKDGQHKSYGVCVGIKGLRRHGTLQMQEVSGNYWITFRQIVDQAERKFLLIPDQAPAFEARLFDTATLRQYGESYTLLKTSGLPHEAIAAILGIQPYVSGVGYYKPGEQSKMTPVQCAMFRAEKDALKRRFILPFGATEAVEDDTGEIVNGDVAVIEPERHEPKPLTSEQHANHERLLGRAVDDETLLEPDKPHNGNAAVEHPAPDKPPVIDKPSGNGKHPEPLQLSPLDRLQEQGAKLAAWSKMNNAALIPERTNIIDAYKVIKTVAAELKINTAEASKKDSTQHILEVTKEALDECLEALAPEPEPAESDEHLL